MTAHIPEDARGWVALVDACPPHPSPALLVTNNINARNAHGFSSHVWLVSMVHQEAGNSFSAFDGNMRKIESLSHWRYALPEEAA